MAYELIETVELASPAAAIQFNSIPQDGTDLLVLLSVRNTTTNETLYLRFNGVSGFSSTALIGTGNSATHGNPGGAVYKVPDSGDTASTFGNVSFYISNYTSSSNKSWSVDGVTENNGGTAYQFIQAGVWSNTNAITSLSFQQDSDIATNSTASLYKITAA